MAYALHIEREGSPIALEEWLAAAAKVDSLRPRASDYSAVNPTTGETIGMNHSEGDLELAMPRSSVSRFLGKQQEWQPAFHFSQGRATFNPPGDLDSPNDPLRVAAATLAKALGAKIVGDEGEEYRW